MYDYRASITRVVDADTVHAAVDLGCDVTINLTLRLAGIDAPEQSTPEGKTATDYLAGLLHAVNPVLIRTVKDRREKYGRYLASLYLPDGRCVNDLLVESGHAIPYRGT